MNILKAIKYPANWFAKKATNGISIITVMMTSLWHVYKYRRKGKEIIKNTIYKQILFTGWDGLRVIGFVAYLIGAVVFIIGTTISQTIGGQQIFGILAKYVLIRELAPLITAIILIARSGAAIATEIGNMKVNNEIDVLRSMGIDIRHYIIGPRIIGFIISILGLTFYFVFIAIAGGYIIPYLLEDIRIAAYIEAIFTNVSLYDIGVVVLKSVTFGLIIATISCYNGFLVGRSSTEVPIYSTKGVVSSLNLCFLSYAYLTALSYI